MRRLFLFWVIALLTLPPAIANAQQGSDSLQMRFMDVEIPLANVGVYSRNGVFIARSDANGYVHIPSVYIHYGKLIAMLDGYKPDTLRQYSPNIYMQPLSATLQQAVVSSKTFQRVLQSSLDYVVDYDFVGDNVLVAAYDGNNGKNAKVFILNNFGDTIAMQRLPEEPISLFRSCVGHYYCVCYGKFYSLEIDSNKLNLGQAYDIKYLPSLKQCQLSYAGYLYYKIVQPDSFIVTYSFLAPGDSMLHVFLQFHDSSAYLASREEDLAYTTEYERLYHKPKFNVGYLRDLWDLGALKMIDVPLYTKDDSLLVFDLRKKQIRYFNWEGVETKTTPMSFAGKNFNAEIIKDMLTERFFLHPINHLSSLQTLNEIKLGNGSLDYRRLKLDRPFAENIKVHNGYVYFLWQDNHHSGTRQLFVQKGL